MVKRLFLHVALGLLLALLAPWGMPLLPVAAEDDVMETLKEAVEVRPMMINAVSRPPRSALIDPTPSTGQGLSEESAAGLRETLRKGKEALEEVRIRIDWSVSL